MGIHTHLTKLYPLSIQLRLGWPVSILQKKSSIPIKPPPHKYPQISRWKARKQNAHAMHATNAPRAHQTRSQALYILKMDYTSNLTLKRGLEKLQRAR